MAAVISMQNLLNAVVYLKQGTAAGTGTLFIYNEKLFLVTAEHVGKVMTASCEVILHGDNDLPVSLKIEQLAHLAGGIVPWDNHSIGDIAILQLFPDKKIEPILADRFLPSNIFFKEVKAVSRDTELTVIGFPLGLGAKGHFSPLTFKTYASSGLLTMPRGDTKTLSDFVVLENPSVGGYSGGPIVDTSIYRLGPGVTTTGNGTVIYGIMHGTVSDNTGGKLAAVTPTYYLFDLLKKYDS